MVLVERSLRRFIVMAVTDPDADPYRRMSMFLVPAGTPGIEILRNVGLGGQDAADGTHAHMRYCDVRVPAANMLGERGDAFVVAQTRLGGGRIHHAMRAVAGVFAVGRHYVRASAVPAHAGLTAR